MWGGYEQLTFVATDGCHFSQRYDFLYQQRALLSSSLLVWVGVDVRVTRARTFFSRPNTLEKCATWWLEMYSLPEVFLSLHRYSSGRVLAPAPGSQQRVSVGVG